VNREPVDVRVPGDKSITHRALILGALASGESRLDGLLDAADTRSTAAVLARLGVAVAEGTLSSLRLRGVGVDGLAAPASSLDCGNSGTTARLLLGALAGCPFETVLTGDDSLRGRPMRRVTEPLAAAGARFTELEQEDRLPIRVHGARPLEPLRWRSRQASAQVKSALLLAGITAGTPVEVTEPLRSRDHTERMLRAMGARLEEWDGDGHTVRLEPPPRLDPLDLAVPGDISSAVFFLALGTARRPVRVLGVGLNPGRTGALRVLARMGCDLTETVSGDAAGEPFGDVSAAGGPLTGTVVEPAEVPSLIDEIPLLAVLAAGAGGETRFGGVAELRVKESDRIRVTGENLRRLGVQVEWGPDHLVVEGREGPLEGSIDAAGDHRIAMAFGVLGSLGHNRVEVRGAGAVDVSFPQFWHQLKRINRTTEER
jgi:3-phosphoshikimate 1-carboxyvinyltransferase